MRMKTIRLPKHIYWSAEGAAEVDLDDPAQKRWWIRQVLTNGTIRDIRALDLRDIEDCLFHAHLPRPVRTLWSDYFAGKRDS